MLCFTINDFSGYGHLSGYSVKGHFAGSICEENMCYVQLKRGKNLCIQDIENSFSKSSLPVE